MRGFTLIELLVVVTIIVVLLALLVPAMDRAIYQAELTVCAANQRAIASASLIYAAEHKRHYPHRVLSEAQGVKSNHIHNANAELDERPILRQYFGVNASLNDPFTERIDFEGSRASSSVEVDLFMWFGWRWRESAHAGRGMKKIGDRFTFNETTGPNTGTHRFDLLVSDRDVLSIPNAFAHASHPDADGRMQSIHLQDGDATGTGLPVSVLSLTMSRWQLDGAFRRGPLDLNFAPDDGSVVRHLGIAIDPLRDDRVFSEQDVEMIAVDEYNNDFAQGSDGYIPSLP